MSFTSCVLRCFGPLLRYVDHPDDTKEDVLRKQLMIPVSCIGFVVSVLSALSNVMEGATMAAAKGFVHVGILTTFILYVVVTKRCPQQAAGLLASLYGTGHIASDILTYGLVEYYTAAVVIMDILLLCNCHRAFTYWIFAFTVVVIFVSWSEQLYGTFGIYNAIPESYSGYERPEKKQEKIAVALLTQRTYVFAFDFFMTRYFAKGMREQREQVERSVVVAQRIASALARFDLDKAQEMVEGAEGLPLELQESFTCLLGNLRSYKPYLPQSCLPDEVEVVEAVESGSSEGTRDHQESGSNSSSPSFEVVPGITLKHVTLLQLNVRDFLGSICGQQPSALSEIHSQYIEQVLRTTRTSRGLVEHFLCDRVLISFNAAKQCFSHRMQGILCAQRLQAIDFPASLTIAVSGGEVLTGPLGCDGLRSYSLVGLLAAWVPLLERVAARLTLCTVTDTSIFNHTNELFRFRLFANAVFDKKPSKNIRLYEYLGPRDVQEEEWMYQLAQENLWDKYNLAKQLLLDGDPHGARVYAQALPQHGVHESLRDDIEKACQQQPHLRSKWIVKDLGVEECLLAAAQAHSPAHSFSLPH